MKILIVSATMHEIAPVISHFQLKQKPENHLYSNDLAPVSVLITGPGIVQTVFHLTHFLNTNTASFVINAGIAGSFDTNVKKGALFNIIKDTFGDLGAEDNGGHFESIFEIGLISGNQPPFKNGWLYPLKITEKIQLPEATSITVNKVTGSRESIDKMTKKYRADLESMEGAGVIYVCNMKNIPCLQIRSVSNHIEPRNKANWDIPKAIHSLNEYLIDFIQGLRAS